MTIQLPEAFKHKIETLLKEEADSFLASYKDNRTAGIRLNPLKITNEKWERISPFSIKKIPFHPQGYYYNYEAVEPGKHPYHLAGLYYIQEPSAMAVADLLDAKPGDIVLDLCAAPGGKSTQIGAAMQNQGLLISNEIHPKRAKALSENVERFGLTNTIVTNETPERLANHFPHYFEKILLDAPCSGEGMFRKDEESRCYWSQEHVELCQKRQLNILDSAYQMLKEGGILVYSTCTFSPEENEQVIEKFIENHPDMKLVSIPKYHGMESGHPEWTNNGTLEVEKCIRLWPHKLKGEGHFAAKFIKTSSTPNSSTKQMEKQKKQELHDYFQFEHDYLQHKSWNNLTVFGSVVHSLPNNCPSLRSLKVLRAGLHLGELKKNRFEPNHALALALRKSEYSQIFNLSTHDETWKQYVRGETIKGNGDYKGWVLLTIDDFPIGWGKESNLTIKNYYPKGLRIK